MASLDVEEDVIENLKNDIEMMKEKFHENYGMTAEELVDIDFENSVTSTSSDADMIAEVSGHAVSTMKTNTLMKSNQLIVFGNHSLRLQLVFKLWSQFDEDSQGHKLWF